MVEFIPCGSKLPIMTFPEKTHRVGPELSFGCRSTGPTHLRGGMTGHHSDHLRGGDMLGSPPDMVLKPSKKWDKLPFPQLVMFSPDFWTINSRSLFQKILKYWRSSVFFVFVMRSLIKMIVSDSRWGCWFILLVIRPRMIPPALKKIN